MSGHSKWATIKRKKARTDAARGKLFSRLTREIIVAAREGGGDPDANTRLRTAIENARANNLPNDNIERAVKRGTGDLPGVEYEEASYELYAPGGVAIIVETLTDNRNRTVSEIRHIVTKYNGTMAEAGSVSWQFEKKGTFVVEAGTGEGEEEGREVDEDTLLEVVLEAGAEDLEAEDGLFYVTCPVEAFAAVRDALSEAGIGFRDAAISQVPQNDLMLEPAQQGTALRILEALEEQDDVQNVWTNLDIQDDALDNPDPE